MKFHILSYADMKKSAAKQPMLLPYIASDIFKLNVVNGFVFMPDTGMVTEETNPLLFFVFALRFMDPFKDKGGDLIASFLFHGEHSTDVLTENVIDFMEHTPTKVLLKNWNTFMLIYCVNKRNESILFL